MKCPDCGRDWEEEHTGYVVKVHLCPKTGKGVFSK